MQGAFTRQRQEILGLTTRYGTNAVLRRSTGDRPCQIFTSNFGAQEMLGREVEPQTRRVLVAATPELTANPPDHDQDRLITFSVPPTNPPTERENLRITEPPTPVEPNGEIAFWRLHVRR